MSINIEGFITADVQFNIIPDGKRNDHLVFPASQGFNAPSISLEAIATCEGAITKGDTKKKLS